MRQKWDFHCWRKTHFVVVAHFFAPLLIIREPLPISIYLFKYSTIYLKNERKPLESDSFSSRISLFRNKEFDSTRFFLLFSFRPQTNSLETQKRNETMSSGFDSSHIYLWEVEKKRSKRAPSLFIYRHKFIMYWQLFPSSLNHSI